MKRHIYTLKKLSALIVLLVLGISANAQTYQVPGYLTGNACSGGYFIDDVVTGGGIQNISKTGSGCGAINGYTYYSAPATPGLITRQGATLTISIANTATGAQAYTAWIDYNDNGFFINSEIIYSGTLGASGTANASFTVPLGATMGDTRLRVRAVRGGTPPVDPATGAVDGEAEDYDVKILSSVVPGCDTVTNMQASNITLTGATLSWTPPTTGWIRFETHISTSSVPPTGTGYNPVTTPSLTVNNLQPSTCYYLHVRTNCDINYNTATESEWTTYRFCTVQDCNQPNVTIDRITGTTAVATWDPVPTVYAYEYAVSTIATPPVSGTITTYTSVQMLGLAPNKGLYFHIRSLCNPTPQSLWKTVPFHTTVGTGVEEVNADNMMVTAYPNPVQNKLYITLDGRIADKATVSIIDVTGKEVYNHAITGSMEVDMSGMPKGIYMLRYADGQSYKIIKIMKD